MIDLKRDLVFIFKFILLYIITYVIGHAFFESPDKKWFLVIESKIYILVFIIFIIASKCRLVRDYLKGSKDKRNEFRDQFNSNITISLLNSRTDVNVSTIDKSTKGLHIVTDKDIKRMFKTGSIIRANSKALKGLFRVQWCKIINGQCHMGLCSA
jgi:hypothetical protein